VVVPARHDWGRTRELVTDLEVPVILAGGLTPDNVSEAIETVDPFAVDVASGVESDGGVKDRNAVEAFVARATAAGADAGGVGVSLDISREEFVDLAAAGADAGGVGVSLDISREEFVDLAADGDGPTVVRAVADLDTDVEPLAAYAALTGRTSDAEGAGDSDYAFLLESAEKVASSDPDGAFAASTDDRHARYSFVGYDPDAVVTVDADDTTVEALDDRLDGLITTNGGDVLDDLRATMPDVDLRGFPAHDRQLLDGGLVGFLAYDAVYDLWLEGGRRRATGLAVPRRPVRPEHGHARFDHAEDSVSLVFTPVLSDGADGDDGGGAGERYDELVAEAERVEEALTTADELETGGSRGNAKMPARERSTRPPSRKPRSRCSRATSTRASSRGSVSCTARWTPSDCTSRSARSTPRRTCNFARLRGAERRRREPRDTRLRRRRPDHLESYRGHVLARDQPCRGPPPRWRDAGRRQGTGRAHDAGRPGA